MRRVCRAEAEVQVEGLIGVDLLRVGDERDRLVDQVLAQVVALLGCARRLDLVVVVDEVGIPLARVAAEEAVEALEAAAERPARVRPRRRLLVGRGEVPLADHECVVALLDQHLREEPVLERHHAVVARIAGGELGDAGHPVAVMVAAGDDTGAARRAERRRVHVRVAQPASGETVEVRCLDRAPVAAELAEAGVVQNDEEHIRGALLGPHLRRPRRGRLVGRPPDHARERLTLSVLDDRHLVLLSIALLRALYAGSLNRLQSWQRGHR